MSMNPLLICTDTHRCRICHCPCTLPLFVHATVTQVVFTLACPHA